MSLGVTPLEIVARGTHPLLATAEHWQRVLLSDVAHVQNGFAFKSAYFHPDDGVPLVRIRDIANEETEHRYFGDFDGRYLIARGDILIGMDGDFGVSRWRGGQALLNQRVCKITLTSDCFDERFLFLCLQPFLDAINAETSSVTVKHLSSRTIEEIPLPLPPLSEQRRIVAKIEELFSELDKGIESLKTARRQLEVYRQSVLKHAFEGRLTAQWREENKDELETPKELLARIKEQRAARHERQLKEWKRAVKTWEADDKAGKKPTKPGGVTPLVEVVPEEKERLPNIPESWCFVRLGQIAEIGSGMSVSATRKLEDPLTVPYLRVANVQRGFLDLSEIKSMNIERSQLGTFQLKEWDVLFNEGGDRDKLGRGWIWQSEITPCITQNHVFRASPYLASESHSKLLSYWANTFGQAYFEKAGKQTTNLASINKTVLSQFPVPLIPYEEQEEICEQIEQSLTNLDAQEQEIASALCRADLLRQSILKKAFSGQLVAQDPNDEPVSVLLDTIRKEKRQSGKRERPRPHMHAAKATS